MAGFLYFFPSAKPPTPDTLRQAGFSLADLAEIPGRECLKGPTGDHGWIFALAAPSTPEGVQPPMLYKPDRQQWREAYDGKLWLGWETADPPNRSDLQRKMEIDGHPVTMADGRAWMVPVLRTRLGETTLPATLGRGPNGTIVQCEVLPQFRELWELVCGLWKAARVDPENLSPDDTFRLAGLALGLNYRVTDWEITQLGLFTTDTLAHTLGAILDVPEAAFNAE